MPSVISWQSIELLHNVIKTLTYLSSLPASEGGAALPKVRYKAKVKLHGCNCAVQVHADGIVTQSRETILTPTSDLKGFSKWAHANEAYFRSLAPGIVVFGEWCGPGVEPGMAISGAPEKQFAVFGILIGDGAGARIVSDPVAIADGIGPLPKNMHVLPWLDGVDFSVDYADQASLSAAAEYLNGVVAAVEKEDPWVKAVFDVSGLGEGVVLYPVGAEAPSHPEALARIMFKAKGLKHRTAGTKEAVQVAPEVVSGVADFVRLMVTEARLEQGLSTTCGGQRDPKRTRDFIAWVEKDVQKESAAELEASGLTWDQVKGAVLARAREWFLRK
jgi:hypothetical protein